MDAAVQWPYSLHNQPVISDTSTLAQTLLSTPSKNSRSVAWPLARDSFLSCRSIAGDMATVMALTVTIADDTTLNNYST